MTMNDLISNAFNALWVIFFAYWLLAALSIKRIKSAETIGSRLSYSVPIWLGYALLLTRARPWGPLSHQIYPRSLATALIGLGLTALGIGFAMWARYTLGRNWSSKVTIKIDHELIRSGPYARVRHPIYTGILLAILGTSIAIGEWRSFLALGLVWFAFYRKARTEEKMLAQEFGERFAEHRQRTGFFIPRLPASKMFLSSGSASKKTTQLL